MVNRNDTVNYLEQSIVQVLRNNGVLNNTHETGTVIRQQGPHTLLVAPNEQDKDPEVIACAEMVGGYRKGDRVLIEYLNGSAHHKYVICVMQRGYEKSEIDYSKLKDTPMRIFRKPGVLLQDPNDMWVDLGDEPPVPLAYKILYDENSPMEWWEILHRDSRGWLNAITTYWPPAGKISFTNYIVRDSQKLMHYFGPDANTSIWPS